MMSPLHVLSTVGMIVFTGTGLCCAVAADRDRAKARLRLTTGVFCMAVMTLAMIDVTLSSPIGIPSLVWALILVLGGPASTAVSSLPARRGCQQEPLVTAMTLHRGISMLTMGVLVFFVHAGNPEQMMGNSGVHIHENSSAPGALIAAGLAYSLVTGGVLCSAARMGGGFAHRLEVVFSAAAIGCMVIMLD